MPNSLRSLVVRGVYDPEDLAALEAIYRTICDTLAVAADDAEGRGIVAKAVFFAFDGGERDVDLLIAAASAASTTLLLEQVHRRPPVDDRLGTVRG